MEAGKISRFLPFLPVKDGLQDHMRSVGDVCYADVHHGEGVVEFTRREDYEQALRKFDDTKFRSHEVLSKWSKTSLRERRRTSV